MQYLFRITQALFYIQNCLLFNMLYFHLHLYSRLAWSFFIPWIKIFHEIFPSLRKASTQSSILLYVLLSKLYIELRLLPNIMNYVSRQITQLNFKLILQNYFYSKMNLYVRYNIIYKLMSYTFQIYFTLCEFLPIYREKEKQIFTFYSQNIRIADTRKGSVCYLFSHKHPFYVTQKSFFFK